MNVTATTQICGIIGDPVDHSLSPVIHNAAFEALGLDFIYAAFPVKDAEAAVQGIRALGLRGVNVTVPHKQTVILFLDEVDGEARAIGAVNTIINEQGRLKGYNTDVIGFITALNKVVHEVKGKRVVVLGSGGAARAVVYGLVKEGAHVTVLNRTIAHAESLVRELGGAVGGMDRLPQSIAQADVLVHATTLGLHHRDPSLVPKELLRKGLVVFDVVYNIEGTQLIRDARVAECIPIPGTEMLLEQAYCSFSLFTGHTAPVEAMKKVINDEIRLYGG
ncbi:MAG: shikimate dehydrogenase [Patescibacteria group bacterium]